MSKLTDLMDKLLTSVSYQSMEEVNDDLREAKRLITILEIQNEQYATGTNYMCKKRDSKAKKSLPKVGNGRKNE